MKLIHFIFSLLILSTISFASCKQNHTVEVPKETVDSMPGNGTITPADVTILDSTDRQHYGNERFRNVFIDKLDNETYLVRGQGQLFEGTLNWVIEDGHDELQDGFATTDMGAPEWGNFSFTFTVKPVNEHTTLHLILFEINAEDGNRRYELPIPLE